MLFQFLCMQFQMVNAQKTCHAYRQQLTFFKCHFTTPTAAAAAAASGLLKLIEKSKKETMKKN